jgi:hypothetical protein
MLLRNDLDLFIFYILYLNSKFVFITKPIIPNGNILKHFFLQLGSSFYGG